MDKINIIDRFTFFSTKGMRSPIALYTGMEKVRERQVKQLVNWFIDNKIKDKQIIVGIYERKNCHLLLNRKKYI